ncbi:MAG: TetR/AcrR family transcriptional regulator C-terminal domain-containing protein [Clostridia bacterium]|nr:TetR/AcrR family transcriptional regulator C-terminal domain-containing protein [Clostridia bacterium]
MSAITKAALSGALKRLLQTKTLDDITIDELAQTAGVSRKTFYYHFQDIYDLLEWTMNEDSRLLLAELDFDNWEKELASIVAYLDANRTLILNVYHSLSHSAIEHELTTLFLPAVTQLLAREPGYDKLQPEDAELLCNLYTLGMVGIVLRWIDDGLLLDRFPPLQKLQMFSRGTLKGFIEQSLEQAEE